MVLCMGETQIPYIVINKEKSFNCDSEKDCITNTIIKENIENKNIYYNLVEIIFMIIIILSFPLILFIISISTYIIKKKEGKQCIRS